MPYSSFTLDEVEKNFKLHLQAGHFLPTLQQITPSSLLQQTLMATLPLAQETGSEKARSEFIIAPILVELRTIWQFFQMQGDVITIDAEEYGLSPVDRILSILKWMVVGDSS